MSAFVLREVLTLLRYPTPQRPRPSVVGEALTQLAGLDSGPEVPSEAVGARDSTRESLDELPQLWNVLRGEMSLVGPRPAMLYIANQCTPWQRMRFRVRPGLTGLWQVLGRKEFPLQQHLEYDVYYAHNVSVALDLAILLKTLPRVLTGRGAY